MKAKALPVIVALLIVGLLALPMTVWAHETVQVGDYTVEYGWVSEPAVAGQPNAVVINISSSASQDKNVDVSGLKVQAVYGGQTKVLTLQPLGENTPDQFVAPITPTRPGKYTVHLEGSIGSTQFKNDVQPEEVQTADVVQFPPLDSGQLANASPALGLPGWLGIAGIVLGLIAIAIGAIALARKPAGS